MVLPLEPPEPTLAQLDVSEPAADTASVTARRSWFLLPLGIFLATRVVDAILLLLALRNQIPASEIPKGAVVPTVLEPKSYFNVIQNWDGQWFRLIAEHGYPSTLPRVDGVVIQNQWAYYPLFPTLTRGVMTVTGLPFGAASALLNLVLAGLAMCLLFRMVASTAGRFAGAMSVLTLSTFPSAVVFQTAYTESLTFLLVLTSIWCLTRRRYGLLLVSGLLLSISRPIVLPLALTVGIYWCVRWHVRRREAFPVRERTVVAAVAGTLVAAFAVWPVVAWRVTGQPDAFLASMDAWKSKDDPSGWTSWLSQAFTGHWMVLAMILAAVGAQAVFLLRPQAARWSPELRIWSFSYAAYLLVSTRPQSSFIRHLIMAVVPWWPFPELDGKILSRRQMGGIAALVACLGFVAQFFWIRWFWVPSSAAISFP